MTPLAAFLTGLTSGGLTCMAVQGGLLLGVLAQRSDEQGKRKLASLLLPVTAFIIAKTIAYTLLGFGLGALGDRLQISTSVTIWIQTIAGLIIVITGIRILVPSWLPWMALTPPASVRRFIRRQTKHDTWVAPAVLGLLTILIPCGTTLAIETSAITTGSAIQGALLLLAFTLGTVPLFFIIGVLAKGVATFRRSIAWTAAAVVITLGLSTLNGVLVMIDSPYTVQNEMKAAAWLLTGEYKQPIDDLTAAETNVRIEVRGTGYIPNSFTVPAGEPVTMTLATSGALGCTSVFRIPKLKIERTLQTEQNNVIVATFPTAGLYTFSCGMGMYTGTITAI